MGDGMIRRLAYITVLLGSIAAFQAEAATQYLDNSIAGNSDTATACTSSTTPCATLTGVLATSGSHTALAAGDTLYIGSHHAETLSANTTYTLPGTTTNPNFIFAADDTNFATGVTPPLTLVTAVSAAHPTITNGAFTLSIAGSFYAYGLTFVSASTSAGAIALESAAVAAFQRWSHSLFSLTGNSATPRLSIGNSSGISGQVVYLDDSQARFANVGEGIKSTVPDLFIRGSGDGAFLASGSSIPTNLLSSGGALIFQNVFMDGVDLSGETGSIAANATNYMLVYVNNSALNASATLISAQPTQPNTIDVRSENSSSSATYYERHWWNFAGKIDTDTSNFQNSGTTYDGTHGISVKMTGSGNATIANPQRSPFLINRYVTTGAHTITVQAMFDSANTTQGWNATTITNKEAWLKCGSVTAASPTTPLTNFTDDRVADLQPSTSSGNQTASASTWTSPSVTGTAEAVKFPLSITTTQAGYYECWVEAVTGNGQVLWVDPAVSVQ